MAKVVTVIMTIDLDDHETPTTTYDIAFPDGSTWTDVHRATVILRDEISRQIEQQTLCPRHPSKG